MKSHCVLTDPVLAAARKRSSSGPREDGGPGADSQGVRTSTQHSIPRRCSGIQQCRHRTALATHRRHHQETTYGWSLLERWQHRARNIKQRQTHSQRRLLSHRCTSASQFERTHEPFRPYMTAFKLCRCNIQLAALSLVFALHDNTSQIMRISWTHLFLVI